jgi:hypothetical protein
MLQQQNDLRPLLGCLDAAAGATARLKEPTIGQYQLGRGHRNDRFPLIERAELLGFDGVAKTSGTRMRGVISQACVAANSDAQRCLATDTIYLSASNEFTCQMADRHCEPAASCHENPYPDGRL